MAQDGGCRRVKIPWHQHEFLSMNYSNTLIGICLDLGCFNCDMLISFVRGVEMYNDSILLDMLKTCDGHPLLNILTDVLNLILKESVLLEFFEVANNVDLLIQMINQARSHSNL